MVLSVQLVNFSKESLTFRWKMDPAAWKHVFSILSQNTHCKDNVCGLLRLILVNLELNIFHFENYIAKKSKLIFKPKYFFFVLMRKKCHTENNVFNFRCLDCIKNFKKSKNKIIKKKKKKSNILKNKKTKEKK